MRSFLLGGVIGAVAGGVGVAAAVLISFIRPPRPAKRHTRHLL